MEILPTNYKQIVWLASYPKSGNTWVRCFLDAYFLGDVDINEIVCSLSDDIAFRHNVGDGSDPTTFPVDIQALTRPMAMLRLVRQYNEHKMDGVPLFVKTHNANMIANGVELLPFSLTKSTIYLIRDPRDVVISFSKHMGCDIDQGIKWFFDKYRVLSDDRVPRMGDFICSWPKHAASFVNADSHMVMTLRYEDLKERTEEAFTKILQHSGVTPDPEKVKRAIELTEISKLKKQEKEKGFKESSPNAKDNFFGKGQVGGWKDILKPYQINKIEKGCKLMLNRFY